MILGILRRIVCFILNLWLAQFYFLVPPFVRAFFGVPPPRGLGDCLPALSVLRIFYRSRIGHALFIIYFAGLVWYRVLPELFWFGVDYFTFLADIIVALNHKLPPRTALEVVVATV